MEMNLLKKSILEVILKNDNITKGINDNIDVLLYMIPEIKDMIGFPHNHPDHHLDVWNHTLLALSLSENDFDIRLCLLIHDIGKPHSYQDNKVRNFKNHQLKSSEMAKNILNRLEYDEDYIKKICYLIENHDSVITKDDIENNYELAKKRFLIQYCDALAHNPKKLEKRIKYLKATLDLMNSLESNTKENVKTKVKYNV